MSRASSSRRRSIRPRGRAAGSGRRGKVEPILVVAVQLVGRDRGAAARAPLGRAVAHDEPAAIVDDPQEAPDVLDVRVGEREVVLAPVHPLAEPDRALGQRADDLTTTSRQRRANSARPNSSISRFELSPSSARHRPRSRAPGSRSRSGSAGGSPAAPCSAGRRPSASAPRQCGPPDDLFAVTGPSTKLNRGPSAFCARSCSKVSSRSQRVEDLARARRGRACPGGMRTSSHSREAAFGDPHARPRLG